MKWNIDPNHSIGQFSIRHMVINTVHGHISLISGTIEADESEPSKAVIEATLDAASINTGVAQRDNDLRGPNFFEVEKYPHITFKSKRVEPVGKSEAKVIGDLTMHGVTRAVTLDVTYGGEGKDPWGNRRATFNAQTQLNRKDFGLTWNAPLETGGFWVGDDVKISLEVQAIPAKVPAPASA